MRRKSFIRKWRLKCRAVADSLQEAGERLFTFTRLPESHMWTAPSSQGVLQSFDQIACAHMSGLLLRSHTNAGQDGFRDTNSKHSGDQQTGHWLYRNVPCRGSIDHTICSVTAQPGASTDWPERVIRTA